MAALHPLLQLLLFFALYLGGAELGHWLSVDSGHFATFWPNAGLFLAVLLRVPPQRWLPFVAAGLAANFTSDFLLHDRPLVMAAGFSLANGLEASVGAAIVRWQLAGHAALDDLRSAGRLLGGAAFGGVVLGSLVGATVAWHFYAAPWPSAFAAWWIADALGVLIAAPLVLALIDVRERPTAFRAFEFVALLVLIALVGAFMRSATTLSSGVPLLFLPWAAIRLGIPGVAAATSAIAVIAVRHAAADLEIPGLDDGSIHPLVDVQVFIAVTGLLAYGFAIALEERRRGEATLELRVAQRTKELQTSVARAESWQARYEAAVKASHSVLYDANHLTGQVIFGGDCANILGYTADELNGDIGKWVALVHPDDRASFMNEFRRVTGQGLPFHAEYRMTRKDGGVVWMRDDGHFVAGSNGGRPVRVVGFVRDVTAERRAEEQRVAEERARRQVAESLNERSAQLEFALGATGVGMWLNPLPLGRLDWDARTRELFFVGPDEEPTAELFYSRLHPDDREPTRLAVEAALRDGTLYSIEHRAVNPATGAVRWVRSMGQATYAPDGTPVRFDGINYDITARRQSEERLRFSEQRFRRLADTLPQIVFTAAPDGTISYVNRYALEYTGLTEVDVQTAAGRIHAEDRERVIAEWRAAIERGQYVELKTRYQRADGEYRWLLCRGLPVRDAAGAIVEWIGACTDVDDLVRLQAELEESAQRKDEFLATLAHELRNPLAPIRNGLQVMKLAGRDPAGVARVRELMERQVEQMTRIIDDLMDLSRISRGRIVLQETLMPLQDAIANAVDSSRVFIEAREQRFEIDVPEAPLQVHADATRLSQVLANLLNNASKFTPQGGTVRLAVRREGEEAVLVVEDSGIGIPPEMLPRVFEMFTQVDRSLERAQSGLGIGLNISKRLVELHGGSISAHSEGVGRGSSFVVRLPLARAQSAAVLPFRFGDEPGRPGGRRILIADDNVDAATSLATLLELMGHQTWTAHDGATAVELAERHRPDIILMDIGMPRLNGYDACRAIRSHDWGAQIHVVAVTGWGQERDRERSAAAGFDGHLTKPVSPEALEDVLASTRAPAA